MEYRAAAYIVVLAVYFGTHIIHGVATDDQQYSAEKLVAVDPAKFTCSKWSPIEPAVFSNTKPLVALTHIFCGQIKEKSTGGKKAEGFHSRPGNKDPTCAKATGLLHNSVNSAYYATGVSVLDAKAMEWIPMQDQPEQVLFLPQCVEYPNYCQQPH